MAKALRITVEGTSANTDLKTVLGPQPRNESLGSIYGTIIGLLPGDALLLGPGNWQNRVSDFAYGADPSDRAALVANHGTTPWANSTDCMVLETVESPGGAKYTWEATEIGNPHADIRAAAIEAAEWSENTKRDLVQILERVDERLDATSGASLVLAVDQTVGKIWLHSGSSYDADDAAAADTHVKM